MVVAWFSLQCQAFGLPTAALSVGTRNLQPHKCSKRIVFIHYLESREQQLLDLDRTIAGFYATQRFAFLLSTGLFLLGWLAEALEVFVMILCLGQPVTVLSALAIGALAVLIKGVAGDEVPLAGGKDDGLLP